MDPYIKHLNELVYTVQMLSEELEIAYDIIDNLFEDEDYELKEEVLLEKKKWIQDAIKKKGSLRKTLKTKEGKNIPVSKLEKAAEKGGKTGKRARLALTLRKLSKKKKLNEDRAELERAAMNPSGAPTPRPSTQRERSLLNLLPKHGGAVHLKLPSVPPISSEMQELERDAMNPSGAPTPKPTTMAERRIRENIKKGQTYTGNGE